MLTQSIQTAMRAWRGTKKEILGPCGSLGTATELNQTQLYNIVSGSTALFTAKLRNYFNINLTTSG